MTATAQSFSNQPLDEIVSRIDEISTLPQVAAQVMAIANDPSSTTSDLKAAVESDPTLSARVLRCVNSSAFMPRSKISNLHHAISYVGFNQVRNLAITGSVSQIFGQDIGIGSYRRSSLWKHMTSVGVCARLIAMRCRLATFEDAFLAGLLHDIGIILEDQLVHDKFVGMIETLGDDRSLLEHEREHLGFDHTELGACIARIWSFPPTVQAAIQHHHASRNYCGEDADIVQCVEVADFVCNLKGITSVGLRQLRFPSDPLFALGFDKDDLAVIADDFDHDLTLQGDILEM